MNEVSVTAKGVTKAVEEEKGWEEATQETGTDTDIDIDTYSCCYPTTVTATTKLMHKKSKKVI